MKLFTHTTTRLLGLAALLATAACAPSDPVTVEAPPTFVTAALVAPDSVVYVGTCVPVSGAVGCRVEGYTEKGAFVFPNVTTWRMVARRPTELGDKIGFQFKAAYVYPSGLWKNFSPMYRWSYKEPLQTVGQSSYATWDTSGSPSGANLTYTRVAP